ncbi:MAG: DUF1176 domain-containing protein [Pseudomonadota bacterium]
MTMILGCFVALLAFTGSVAAATNKEVRDWYVWCDVVFKCEMQTGSGDEVYSIGFERSPQPGSEAVFFMATALKPAAGSMLVAVFDEGAQRIAIATDEAEVDGSTFRFPGQNRDNALMDAMMAGKSMVLEIATDEGVKQVPVSLSGVTGSALFMDEAQERIGDRDALQARGDGEPSGIKTRVTQLNSTDDLPVPIARLWRLSENGCSEGRDEEEDLVRELGGIRVDMDNETELFLLPCGLPGAYNYPQVVLLHDTLEGRARMATLPVIGQKGPTVMDTLYNPSWDDRLSQLSAFFKGRGLGDCGSRQVWEWPQGGDYYSNFELVEEYVKGECDGKYEDWPQIWPPG